MIAPVGAPRALDHIVLPCQDLAAAAESFAALGFLVGRRNRHPWGTENHIVQFPDAFLELIALAPDFEPLAVTDPAFPFAGFLAGQGRSTAPSAMIVLRSSGAAADAAAFAAAGIGEGRMLDFSRAGAAPDGTTRTVAFSLAFADAPAMPDLGFFVCQQHFPENFWNPAMQRHPNGVRGVAALTLQARHPAACGAFLAAFSGALASETAEGGLELSLAGEARLRVEPGPVASPVLTALRFMGRAAPSTTIGRVQLDFG